MEDGQVNSSTSNLPPFLSKTYEMIDDPSTNSIISWGGNNKSFIVWDEPEFSKSLLPTFFKHSNFSSFIRQLNTYGFRKTDPVQWEFANEDFVRDQPHLMLNIHRRRPVHSHSSQNQNGQSGLSISEREEYKDEIEGLRSDRESLFHDINEVDNDHKELEVEIENLRDRLLERQKINESFLSKVARTLHRPQSVIYEWKSRSGDKDDGNMDSFSSTESAEELFVVAESFVNFWEGVFEEFCTGFMENAHLDLNESEEEEDGGHTDVSCTIAGNGMLDSSIYMNCEAVGDESVAGCMEEENEEEHEQAVVGKLSSAANDGFWEQFLTENPGSGKDTEPDKEEGMDFKLWWGFENIKPIPPST